MICTKCGSPMNEGDTFCGACGNQVASAPQSYVPPQYGYKPQTYSEAAPGTTGFKVAGFVLGLLSLIFSWVGLIPYVWGLGFIILIVGIMGIVFSGIGIRRCRMAGMPKGLGIAGLVCAIIAVCLASIYTLVGIVSSSYYY